jgi:AraC-like DNA-binding protein
MLPDIALSMSSSLGLVQLAAVQLREGRSLAQIAYDIGYGSEAALNRAFRQHYGQPPGIWRREHATA